MKSTKKLGVKTIDRIGVITFPIEPSNEIPLTNILDIYSDLVKKIYIITGNIEINNSQKVVYLHHESVTHTPNPSQFSRVLHYIKTQLVLIIHMAKLSKHVDVWIFPICGETLLPCVILSNISNKPAIMSLTSSIDMWDHQSGPFLPVIKAFIRINYFFASRIILYSPTLITNWNLERYCNKISIAHRHFLDFGTLTVTTEYHERVSIIGYIGRLSGEKGVQHFAQALPMIFSNQEELKVLIGGDGQLKDSIEASLRDEDISDRVDMPGWISREELPNYLNKLKLLVLPSYTEGLPNIMLEAMACGTPVLATPVGAIPDVIVDGKTGFIMESNTPECIAENVARVLNSPDLERIAEAGRRFVEENFTFEKAVENWKKILENM